MRSTYAKVAKVTSKINKPIAASITIATLSFIIGAAFTLEAMTKVPHNYGVMDHDVDPNKGSNDKLIYAIFAIIALAAYIPVFLSKKAQAQNLFSHSKVSNHRQSISLKSLEAQHKNATKDNSSRNKIIGSSFAAGFRGLGSISGLMSLMGNMNPYAKFFTSLPIITADAFGQVAQITMGEQKKSTQINSKIKKGFLMFNSVMYPITQLMQYGYSSFNNIISAGLYLGCFKNNFSENWDRFINHDKDLDSTEFTVQFILMAPILALGLYFAYKVQISTARQWDDLINRLITGEIGERKSALKQSIIGILSGMIKAIAANDVAYKISTGLKLSRGSSLTISTFINLSAAVAQGPVIAYRKTDAENSSTESTPLLKL